jgi:hypothetical protein
MYKRMLTFGAAALLAAGLAVGAWALRPGGPPARPAPRRDDWDVPRLVERLHARGLDLHVTPVIRGGPTGRSVYLSETERDWIDLSRLRAAREYVGEWRGVVLCEWNGPRGGDYARVSTWGDACVELPPFVFFGDPALRDRIEEALNDDEP